MKVSKEEYLTRYFVLTANAIKLICRHFRRSDKIIIKATCKDKVTREFSSVDDFVKYDNIQNKSINSLGINVFSGYKMIAFIHFSKNNVNNIFISLEEDEKSVFKSIEFLHDRLSGIEP